VVEIPLDVRIHHPGVPFPKQSLHPLDGLPRSRPVRNPYECSAKPISKIGSITLSNVACTTRSRTVGIPNGRFSRLPGFSIQTRFTAEG